MTVMLYLVRRHMVELVAMLLLCDRFVVFLVYIFLVNQGFRRLRKCGLIETETIVGPDICDGVDLHLWLTVSLQFDIAILVELLLVRLIVIS